MEIDELFDRVSPIESKNRLSRLLRLAKDDKKGFTNLRFHEDNKLFEIFVDYCLVHFVGSKQYYRFQNT
jgi:hypothetical protein